MNIYIKDKHINMTYLWILKYWINIMEEKELNIEDRRLMFFFFFYVWKHEKYYIISIGIHLFKLYVFFCCWKTMRKSTTSLKMF